MSGTAIPAIPAPVTANPEFWKQGIEGLNALRDQQARQASADAYRQATDPATGQVDVPKYNALIASGPGAWNAGLLMEQQGRAAGAQAEAGSAQVTKASAIYNMAGTAAASLMNDPSDANIDNIEAGLKASGAPPEVLAELDRIKGIQDPAQRKVVAYQHTLSMMDAQHRLAAGGFPTPTATAVGDKIVPTMLTPSTPYGGGTMSTGGGGVTVSMTPAEANQPYKYTDSSGKEQSTTVGEHLKSLGVPVQIGGQPVGAPSAPNATAVPHPPANYVARPPPAAPAAPAVPPAATPGGPGTYQGPGFGVLPPAPPIPPANPPPSVIHTSPTLRGDIQGGGVQVASANPSFAPTVGSPGPSSPLVSGDVSAIMQGRANARATPTIGTQTAFNALQSGGVPGPAPAPAPTPASQPAVPPAAASPPATTGGRSISGPAPGVVPAAQDTAKQSAAMGGTLISRGDQAPVQKANLQNMLTDLQKLDSMGPGTDKEIFLNSVMQKLTGYGFSMNRDQIAAGNSFAKLANIAVGQQLAAIGGTDARQSLFMGSNPNLDLSKLGNQRIIQMLMGNEDAIQAKARAWTDWSQSHGPHTYQQFQDDFNRHFDPRVFQAQYMVQGGPELAALRASLEKEGEGAVKKFKDDTKYAQDKRWIQ